MIAYDAGFPVRDFCPECRAVVRYSIKVGAPRCPTCERRHHVPPPVKPSKAPPRKPIPKPRIAP